MSDWLRNSLLYEINTWVWLGELSLAAGRKLTLGDVPDRVWDELANLGVTAVWLMGVWERSPAAVALSLRDRPLLAELRRSVPDLRNEDLVGSPYSIRRYQVDPHLGGPEGLAAARQALGQRGIRLVLDFVPNHVAIDHAWVSAHPDWLIQGSSADLRRAPHGFRRLEGRVFAHGRDPYFPPWSDVLQLNVFNAEERSAAVIELRTIANQCDGVRCDMAMLVLNEIFARTWGPRAGTVPAQDYWQELIPAIKASHPQFRFIAEAYWDLEVQLLEQGFDACYDKILYDRLAQGSAQSIEQHLLRPWPPQDRFVRFLENHDEARAAHTFPGAKALAATVVLLTLPGVRLVHEGQLEGRTIRAPVHVGRRPVEAANTELAPSYRRLLGLAGSSLFRLGRWFLCAKSGWDDNSSYHDLLAWGWQEATHRWLIVVNYSDHPAQGRIRLPWPELGGKQWRLTDFLPGLEHARPGDELVDPGLFVDLPGWAFHLFRLVERP